MVGPGREVLSSLNGATGKESFRSVRLTEERCRYARRHRAGSTDASAGVDGRFWVVLGEGAGCGSRGRRVFSRGTDLPVFSVRSAAEAFLDARVTGDGWSVREVGVRELLLMLGKQVSHGRCDGYKRVVLDPPEVESRVVDELVTVSRDEFEGRLAALLRGRSSGSRGYREEAVR